MLKRLILLACAALFAACSTDSTPPTTSNYSLQLQFTSPPSVSGTVASFDLKVTRSGAPVQGATLKITTYPKDTVITSKILSGADGAWTNIGVVMGASTQQVAFQAFKDTMTSNFVVYAP
ncbi:MAG: hypothetical protein Q8922_15145 [Bacteroidota bacterium]|nr:hypothetical protein [Bacteroidota bacterium]MDP4231744.1 hypothetical protein [Bacteroidota bacterium]MDP4243480.1 hypothetical protein [Bacteroidota bacterium]MDP4289252.1 hypothetical protein [Bacteroidota bacterium]